MKTILLIVFGFIVIGIIIGILKRLSGGRSKADGLPYESRGSLLTAAEQVFYGVLVQALDGYRVMSKVRHNDVVDVRKGLKRPERQSALNRIQRKHVDFVVCEPADLRIVCVIELDDSSHEKADRQDRDALVDDILKAAGIPITHFPVKKSYTVEEIQTKLQN